MKNEWPPVFILGTPRSGTTLLRLILDSHPDIAITPESSFFFRVKSLWEGLYPDLNDVENIRSLIDDLHTMPQIKDWIPKSCTFQSIMEGREREGFDSLAAFIDKFFGLYAESKSKHRWGDKTPKNLHSVEQILELFPSAKILMMVRDCRDVTISLNKADFSKVSYLSAARRWQMDADIAQKYLKQNNDQIYLLRYEDLLLNPSQVIKSVLSFLNLSDDPEIMKRYVEHEDDVVHTKSSLYMKPIEIDNLYKWKKEMSVSDVAECEAIARNGLVYFGYEVSESISTVSRVKVFIYRIKDLLQLLVNSKNMENYYVYIRLLIKSFLRRCGIR